jgi:hypothetical protein
MAADMRGAGGVTGRHLHGRLQAWRLSQKGMGSRGVVGLPQWISYLVVPRGAYETSALRSARDRARRPGIG